MAANKAERSVARRQNLRDWALGDPVNAEILRRLPEVGLAEAYLVAGCVYQAVWNRLSGFAPGAMIKDYDIFYFDGADLSWAAEDRVIRRAAPRPSSPIWTPRSRSRIRRASISGMNSALVRTIPGCTALRTASIAIWSPAPVSVSRPRPVKSTRPMVSTSFGTVCCG
jgi:hypothetical protein